MDRAAGQFGAAVKDGVAHLEIVAAYAAVAAEIALTRDGRLTVAAEESFEALRGQVRQLVSRE